VAEGSRGAGARERGTGEPTARLLIEYDGTDFFGWARQPGRRTVQEELERALSVVLRREAVTLTVAGRTDAGVHASGQVASHAGEPAPAVSLNGVLPYDVAVASSQAAAPGFDARRDATSRAYCYRVLNRRARSPRERRWTLHWPHTIDRDALHACAAALGGVHDFTAFTPSRTVHTRFARDVYACWWREHDDDMLEFWIEADAFMRGMIRALVGTMLDVAGGRQTFEDFRALLDGRPRPEAGESAAAHGLTLFGVGYEERRVLTGPPNARRAAA
jgi:tRNA pseudouridine38-40 synthase